MKFHVYFQNKEAQDEIAEKLNLNLSKDIGYIDLEGNTKKAKKVKAKEVFTEPLWVDCGMPEYIRGEAEDFYSKIQIDFGDRYTLAEIKEIFNGQNITDRTSYIKYPKVQNNFYNTVTFTNKRSKYPIYIPSKGRWDVCKTAEFLTAIDTDFYIIVEEQEYDKYKEFYPESKLLILPKSYQENYDTLDDLGLTKSVGPGAARNFAWEHSIENGFEYHWVLDDNVPRFFYYNDNEYSMPGDSGMFAVIERFIESYDNIGMASMNYSKFVARKASYAPYIKGTRMYSMILIKNDLPYRWRGRYNEDTIISLDLLSHGIATIQFNYVQGDKMTTQTLKGGNSEVFYFSEGTLPKSIMLEDEYPDVAKLEYKFKRWHHHVNYKQFPFIPGNLTDIGKSPYNLKLIDVEYKPATAREKSIVVDELAVFTREKLKSTNTDYEYLENARKSHKSRKDVSQRKDKKDLKDKTVKEYVQGYFVKEYQDEKILVLGDIPDDLQISNDCDIINLGGNPKIARYCFRNHTNMYDIQDKKEAYKLATKVIVYDNKELCETAKKIADILGIPCELKGE